MGSWPRLILLVILSTTATTAAFRQSATSHADHSATYRQLVAAYRSVDADTMRRLAALPPGTVSSLVDAVLSARGAAAWAAGDVIAAAMLHTDTGIELMKAGLVEQGVFHVNVAARLIDRTADTAPLYTSYAGRWYAVVAAILHSYEARAWALEFNKRQRTRQAETAAGEVLTRALREELEAAKEPPGRFAYRDAPPAAVQAGIEHRYSSVARLFEQAVHVDPECYEGWLHLGRTRMLAGNDRAAIAALERAVKAHDPRHQYLAIMFLGAIAERQQRFADAEQRYRQASALYPWGQSAPVALSQLLSRCGRDADAREILVRYHARAKSIAADPLWTYLLGTNEHLAARLNELRVEVWR